MLVLQTMFNDKMDRRLGLPTAALIRFTIGLGGLAVLMSYFPMLATSHQSLLSVTGEHSYWMSAIGLKAAAGAARAWKALATLGRGPGGIHWWCWCVSQSVSATRGQRELTGGVGVFHSL